MQNNLTKLTRRNILEEVFQLGNPIGRLALLDFIERIWPIEEMPSTDPRCENASGDIYLHAVHFNDWDIIEVFLNYLDIQESEDFIFLNFLETLTHPEVRINKEEQTKYVEVINIHLKGDGFQLIISNYLSGYPIYSIEKIGGGVQGNIQNLIFAADGYKPKIILKDILSNKIEIVENREFCLIYDREVPSNGLLWRDLVSWWQETYNITGQESEVESGLHERLIKSLSSSPLEKVFYELYFQVMLPLLGNELPAIIPQVYLHYDPYTLKMLKGNRRIARERMDFLLLLKNRERIIIEIDGKHHYADDNNLADASKYASMVREDRELKLNGYEVYRIGGAEFKSLTNTNFCKDFLHKLFKKHGYLPE